jgi:ATP sulfurylase
LGIPIEFPTTIVKGEIVLDNSSHAAYILEPYYIPCKARQFLEYTDQQRWITILRQILNPHGWELIAKESTRSNKKVTHYTIQKDTNFVVDSISVDFL